MPSNAPGMLVAARLNESPSEKEGKSVVPLARSMTVSSLNESPSEKEGKSPSPEARPQIYPASMKVPPKRKGNRWRLCACG